MNKIKTAVLIVCVGAAPAPASVAAAPAAPAPASASASGPAGVFDAQQSALTTLGRLASVPAGPMVHPWKSITCGPALWKRLVARDAGLANRGVKAVLGKAGQAPAGAEARSFSPSKEDAWLYKSPALQQLAKTFSSGAPRPAAVPEREAFSALAPFELGAKPVTIIEAAGEALLVYVDPEAELLWLDLVPPGRVETKPVVTPSTASAAASAQAAPAVSPDVVYPVSDLRDPFIALPAGGAVSAAASAGQCAPGEFSIHTLSLHGIMKDRSVEYAVFANDVCKTNFVLRKGKLYDDKGRTVNGVEGGLNLRRKSAHLKSEEGDVQIFRLGEQVEQAQ